MRRVLRENGLTFALAGLFLVFLIAQSLTGWRAYNGDRSDHAQPSLGYASYLGTGQFVEATFENWESEFLQMAAYIMLTIWLVQKGSSESRPLGVDPERDSDPSHMRQTPDSPAPVRRGGWRLKIYENSLGIAFAVLFVMSFGLHALGGARDFSAEQMAHGDPPVSVARYVTTSTFWFQSFQNWQSEFLAVASIVVLSIFLRQRRSPESKPVASPHDRTGS